ncbi:ribonuclease H-like domain-containing protein [Tanacetum coccineum]
MLKSELEKLKQEKESNQLKIENFNNASKSLDKLIGSQIPDKSRKGLGFVSYNAVPPPPTGLLSLSKFDLSNSGLEEFQQPKFKGYGPKTSKSISEDISNEVRESPDAPLVEELVSDDNQKVITAKGKFYTAMQKAVNTARPNSAVVNVVRGNQGTCPISQTLRNLMEDMLPLGEELNEMCDKKNCVLFTDTGCFVLSLDFKLADESHVLLKVPRKNNMYSVDMKNIVPKDCLTCLVAKVTSLYELCYAYEVLGKFDGKSYEGFFVGYSLNSKDFKVYNIRTRKVEENLHIRFLENKPIIAGDGPKWLFDIDVVTKSMNYVPVAGTNSNDFIDGSLFDSSSKNASNDEPQPSSDARKKDDEDMFSMGDNATLEATHADFFGDETEVDMSNITTTYLDFVVYQMDVKSAFLYGKNEEEVYVCQPPGFEDPEFPDRVYKVKKALHGLHQAPKACQDKYVDEILKKFGFSTVKTASTPMETSKPLLKDVEAEDVDIPVTPKVSHLHAVKRIFRYLKGQPKLGLWYPNDSPFDLEAYSDSDYAGASLDRKSTIGGCQFLGSRLISWQCKKQTIVANSTTEAEYVTAASCCGQTKHTEIRHHFIRDSNEKKLIQMIKIHIDQNVTDLLTKAFDRINAQMMAEMEGTIANDEIQVSVVGLTFYWSVNAVRLNLVLLVQVNVVEFAETHNLVAFLEKPKESDGFEGIIDFLNASSIRYALTCKIQALVDGKKVIITETSVRRALQLKDAEGTECLPNATIFAELERMRRVTPLFQTMMVQALEELGEGLEIPIDPQHTPTIIQPSTSQPQKKQLRRKQRKDTEVPQPSGSTEPITDEAVNEEHVPIYSNDPLLSGEDRLKLNELMELCTNLSQKVLDLENTKTSQATEIAKLKERVKKLERRNKSRTPGLKRLRKVGRSAQVVSFEDEEVTLFDEAQERNDDNLMFDTGVFDE